METREEFRNRIQQERGLIERLRTADLRFEDAQLERMWAIKSAHEDGLSIRQIAAATGLSSSRIHQVLNTGEPAKIPTWVTAVRDETAGRSQDQLAAEVRLLRQCIRWLHQLERGEDVIVNLRPDTDEETEYVRFDRPRVVRILERITADLDQLGQGSDTQHDGDPTTQHRRRPAEPPPPTRRLSTREARDSLRAELKLLPK